MAPEVPLEQTQEEIAHHAHTASESWIMGVALTAAVLAAMAAIGSLLAEHYANEAMLEQIQSSDHWGFFQAKGIKAAVLLTKIELRTALDKPVDPADRAQLDRYKQEQAEIKEKAEELAKESRRHAAYHKALGPGVTMFQLGIAIGAVAVLTRRKPFWYVSIAFGIMGAVFLGCSCLL